MDLRVGRDGCSDITPSRRGVVGIDIEREEEFEAGSLESVQESCEEDQGIFHVCGAFGTIESLVEEENCNDKIQSVCQHLLTAGFGRFSLRDQWLAVKAQALISAQRIRM